MADPIKSSPWLYKFYVDYGKWLSGGAIPGLFSCNYGLCANLFDYFTEEAAAALLEEMHASFVTAGLDERLPFNADAKHFASESRAFSCHLNQARVAWVRARIEDGETGVMVITAILGQLVKKEWSNTLLIEVNETYMGENSISWFFPEPEKVGLKGLWVHWHRDAFIGFDDGVPF